MLFLSRLAFSVINISDSFVIISRLCYLYFSLLCIFFLLMTKGEKISYLIYCGICICIVTYVSVGIYMCYDRGSLHICLYMLILCRGSLAYLIYVLDLYIHVCHHQKRENVESCCPYMFITWLHIYWIWWLQTYGYTNILVYICILYSHMSCRSKGGYFDGDIAHTCWLRSTKYYKVRNLSKALNTHILHISSRLTFEPNRLSKVWYSKIFSSYSY